MKEFLKIYGGYIIGFISAPIINIIIKTLKGTFKRTVNKKHAEEHHD